MALMDKALVGKSTRFSQKIRPTYALANPVSTLLHQGCHRGGKGNGQTARPSASNC